MVVTTFEAIADPKREATWCTPQSTQEVRAATEVRREAPPESEASRTLDSMLIDALRL